MRAHLLLVVIAVAIGLAVWALQECNKTVGSSGDYRLTYYGEEFRGGLLYCEEYGSYDPDDLTTAATRDAACGQQLQVCATSCVVVTVKDRCGGCGERHIDLSEAAWHAAGGEDWGTVLPLAAAKLPSTGIGGD